MFSYFGTGLGESGLSKSHQEEASVVNHHKEINEDNPNIWETDPVAQRERSDWVSPQLPQQTS